MNRIIILSGPIGAGKTTLAKALVAIYPRPLVNIEGDRFWSFFDEGCHLKSGHTNFQLTITALLTAAIPFSRGDYDVLIDFSIPPEALPRAKKIFAGRESELNYILVCPNIEVCATRAANRSEGKITDYSFLQEFFGLFALYEGPSFDSEKVEPKEAAEELLSDLDLGNFRF